MVQETSWRKVLPLLAVTVGLAVLVGCGTSTTNAIQADVAVIPGRVAVVAQRADGTSRTSIRATEVFPAASMAKLAILLAALEHYWRPGHYQDRMIVRAEDLVASSAVLKAKAGDRVPVYALAAMMIENSDNRAANILISNLTVAGINDSASRAGLGSTKIFGLYTDAKKAPARARTSASDVATVLGIFARGANGSTNEVLPIAACRLAVQLLSRQTDRSIIPAALGGNVQVANKTAAVVGMRGDAGIIEPSSSNPMIVVVLVDGLPAYDPRHAPPLQYRQALAGMRKIATDVYGE